MARKNNGSTITIKDIASRCGVSISTVSNVLNGKAGKVSDEVAARIREAVVETGYRPNFLAKGLRAQATQTIGVIVEDLIVFSVPSMMEGVMRCCESHGYDVVIENMRLFGRWHGAWMHDEALFQSALQPVLTKIDSVNVDGILYIGGHEHRVSDIKSASGLPIAMAYSIPADRSIPNFRLDDTTGGYDAIRYLLSMGHRDICVIAGESDNTHTIHRVQGIQKAFFEAGILFDPERIVYMPWTKQGGYDGMERLSGKTFTAVFAMSDTIATGVYAWLTEKGMLPGRDISVMGYDNQEIADFLTPGITTMALPLEEIGSAAAQKLIDMIEKPQDKQDDGGVDIRLRSTLVERNSVLRI